MKGELLAALANERNQRILELLAVEPSYPRRVATLLDVSETEVARRLKALERCGLVNGTWERHRANVRVYRLAMVTVRVQITAAGITASGATDAPAQPLENGSHLTPPPPPPPPEFVGRDGELDLILGPDPVALVVGIAGSGKTSLIAQYAVRERRPVFWRTFVGVESLPWLANHLGMFLAEHGHPELLRELGAGNEPADAADAVLAALGNADVAVVLDGVEAVQDAGLQSFIAAALRHRPKGKLVVTSRTWIPCDPATPGLAVLRLGGLDLDSAVTFLRQHGVEVPTARRGRLQEGFGGHPLSLALLAQAARVRPLDVLLEGAPDQELAAWLLREIDSDLTDDERIALVHASVFSTPFSPPDLAAVAKRRLDGALVRLRRRLLVQESQLGLVVHEVVRNYFRVLLDRPQEVHLRAAEHALAKGTMEARLEAFHHFHQAGRHDRVLKLVEDDLELHAFDFIGAGYQRLYLETLESIAPGEVKEARHRALILDERGDLYLHQDRPDDALEAYRQAASEFAAAGNAERERQAREKADLASGRLVIA